MEPLIDADYEKRGYRGVLAEYDGKDWRIIERHQFTDVTGPGGILLNWNNRSAPGFMHGDDEPYGSVQRVEMFNRFPAFAHITDNVGIMNRAATQDVRSPVWPIVSRVLHTSSAPSPRDAQVVSLLDDWVGRDAPRLDADADTFYDEPGPVIMDAVWRPITDAVMSSVFGALLGDLFAADLADPAWNTSGVPWTTLYYKENYPRLQQVKKRYDPRNTFHHRLAIELPD